MIAGDVKPYVPNELLSRLVGCHLYSVSFEIDGVRLLFVNDITDEQPHLQCFAWPHVELNGTSYAESTLGFGDALRSLIGGTVTSTTEATGVGLRLDFSERSVRLHPAIEDVYVEIGMLSGLEDEAWMVWRPGEDSFEDL
jgi:hypothetical protein